jgi:hypothetical protein
MGTIVPALLGVIGMANAADYHVTPSRRLEAGMSWEKRAHFFKWWPSQQGYPSGMTIPIVEVSGSICGPGCD